MDPVPPPGEPPAGSRGARVQQQDDGRVRPPGLVLPDVGDLPDIGVGSSSAKAEGVARGAAAAAPAHTNPPPSSLRGGPSAQLWAAWQRVDSDGSASVSREEFTSITDVLDIPPRSVEDAWLEAVAFMRGKERAQLSVVDLKSVMLSDVNYYAFIHAFNAVRGAERRETRSQIRATFLMMQKQPSGLKKAQMKVFIKRVRKHLMLLPPEFDLETDWEAMLAPRTAAHRVEDASASAEGAVVDSAVKSHLGMGTLLHDVGPSNGKDNDDDTATVSFVEFEKWWKFRMGLWETNQAVLPEFFEYKFAEAHLGGYAQVSEAAEVASLEGAQERKELAAASPMQRLRDTMRKRRGVRQGKDLWSMLRPKMSIIMMLKKSWGNIDNNARDNSAVHDAKLPWFIRNPDSRFSGIWDVASVVFLVYVCITVPVRACFPNNIIGNRSHLEVLSLTWTIDTVCDIYFIADVIMNFFTAVPNSHDGTPIADRRQIAVEYLKGWFWIDFLSSLPIEHISMIAAGLSDDTDSSQADDGPVDLRFLKSIRLLRLSKMLRLARLKRIMNKYENLAKVQEYGNIALVLLIIVAGAHVMACFWYLAGTANDYVQGDERQGWVNAEWDPPNDPNVPLAARYTAAIYRVFNLFEPSRTSLERNTAVLYHVLLLMVDGAVAGVMSALMIAMQGQEREYNERISTAKQWMKEQRIPKFRAEPALEYFRSFYRSNVAMEEAKILGAMTPAMRIEFTTFLYSKFVANVPLFSGLTPGITRVLCGCVEPTFAVRQQVIYGEGTTGREMYIVISGELEITSGGNRLGFISDGGFFGETPILEDSPHAEVRRRTVTAVTACKLCFIHADKINLVRRQYPELGVRLARCSGNTVSRHNTAPLCRSLIF